MEFICRKLFEYITGLERFGSLLLKILSQTNDNLNNLSLLLFIGYHITRCNQLGKGITGGVPPPPPHTHTTKNWSCTLCIEKTQTKKESSI